ncbi:MAG: hypothetical protein C4326_02980 [Ignavibacteria bacterium]
MDLSFRNRDLEAFAPWRQAEVTLWNREVYRRVREAMRVLLAHTRYQQPGGKLPFMRAGLDYNEREIA